MTILRAATALPIAALLVALIGSTAEAGEPVPPLIPRSEMLAVDELRPGMKGVGKSVFRGTRVEEFGVTVLGVLRKVNFDGDIILIRIDSGPPVSQGFGVVSGMSGSPIYVNGKLIGALAYAWQFAKIPIAGVTPIAQMLEAYQPGSSPVRRQGTLRASEPFSIDGRQVERAVVLPNASAVQPAGPGTVSLVPIATPVLVSGLSPALIEVLGKGLEPYGLIPVAGAGAAGQVATRMVPGQAVGARLVGGDLDLTAVGTVTYVKGDVVLAFGHPMASLGSTDMPLVAAYVHGVMPSSMISFKLASGGQTLGHFTEDRPWCVGGRLGGKSELIDAGLSIADLDRGVARDYGVEVVRNRTLTSLLLVAVLAGAIDSVGPPAEGTTRARFSLEAEGLPPLERENTYAAEDGDGILSLLFGAMGGAASATAELSQMLDVLRSSEFGEARLDRLDVSIELTKDRRLARLEDARIRTPIVRAGDEVPIVIDLRTSDGGISQMRKVVTIPEACPPGRVRVGVAGGRDAEVIRARLDISEPRAMSMKQMVGQMLGRPSNDDIVIEVALPTVGIEARGHVFKDLPPSALDLLRSSTARRLRLLRDHVEHRSKTDWVVSGSAVLTLVVEGEEKDKGGRLPSPEYESPRYEQIAGGLGALFPGMYSQTGRASTGTGPEGEKREEEIDVDAPPPMPSWEEVETVGERELTVPSLSEERPSVTAPRSEAVGRVASVWRLGDPKELLKGEAKGTAVVSTGGITLAPEATEVTRVEARCLWPVAASPDGSVYLGSWTDGAVRRTAADGETVVILETAHAGIQAVAAGPDGTVYAAGVPGGTIYRLKPGEEPAEVGRLGVQNVWAMAVGESGDLWVATGGEGKLYRMSPDGNPSVVFAAADRHITCLAAGPDGALYLGTSPRGKVYAVSPDGSVRSVCELEDAAINSIAVDAQGSVYVGSSPKARVLKIAHDGSVRELLGAKGKHVLCLSALPDGTVYAAVGPQARVFVIYPDESSAMVSEVTTAYVAGLAADAMGNLYATAADSGRLIKLESTGQRVGSYLSVAHDAGAVGRWGAVRWRGSVPEGTSLRVFTRTGDTAHPDTTWTTWQEVAPGPGASVPSPPGRYLQCRLDLSSEGLARPEIDMVEFTYLPANRAPEVKLAAPKADEIWSGRQTIRWSARDPDRDDLAYEVFWSSDRGNTWAKIESETAAEAEEEGEESQQPEGEGEEAPEAETREELPGEPGESAALLSTGVSDRAGIAARQMDEFEDSFGEEGGPEVLGEEMAAEEAGLEEEPEEYEEEEERPRPSALPSRATSIKWNTAEVPDGTYWVKVVASDEKANPAEPREGEAVSRAFLIDNTPPELIVDRRRHDDDPPPESITVFELMTYVTSAEFKVDDGEWLAGIPRDGIFDGQYEAVLLDLERLPEGAHEIEIRARDAAANVTRETLRYKR